MSKASKGPAAESLLSGLAKLGPSYADYLDRNPLLIENLLASEDQSLSKSAIPMLIAYLRRDGRPMLALLADWLDPEAKDIGWKLTHERRGRGNRPAKDRRAIEDAGITYEVTEAERRLHGHPARGRRKKAIGEVAKARGIKDGAIRAALTRHHKLTSK